MHTWSLKSSKILRFLNINYTVSRLQYVLFTIYSCILDSLLQFFSIHNVSTQGINSFRQNYINTRYVNETIITRH